eukprot:2213190-Lingulodinium_polyedra.AAC.1
MSQPLARVPCALRLARVVMRAFRGARLGPRARALGFDPRLTLCKTNAETTERPGLRNALETTPTSTDGRT